MSEYHLHAKTHSRGAGKGAGGHVRYILREGPYARGSDADGIRYTRAPVELAHSESGHLPEWAKGKPAKFWDAADEFERANGTVYREIEFALPKELSEPENIELARTFAHRLSSVEGGETPYTLAIHRSEKDSRLLHCHLMLSDKINDGIQRDPLLWFKRAANKGKEPATGGAPKTQARISHEWLGETVRPLWEQLANDALARAGHTARIDRRTLEEQRADQERIAAQALRENDTPTYLQAIGRAAALDHQPQPKLGRVYTHKGAKKAPGQAAMLAEYEAIDAEQRREAERVAELRVEALVLEEELQKAQAILDRAKERHGYRLEPWAIRERWSFRQQQRELNRQAEIEAERQAAAQAAEQERLAREAEEAEKAQRRWMETEPWAPLVWDAVAGQEKKKTPWQEWREKTLTERYGPDLAAKAESSGEDWYIRMRPDLGGLHIRDKVGREAIDAGSIIKAEHPGGERDIPLMIELIKAKGWKEVGIEGGDAFRLKMAMAVLENGLSVSDKALAEQAWAEIEQQQPQEQSLPFDYKSRGIDVETPKQDLKKGQTLE